MTDIALAMQKLIVSSGGISLNCVIMVHDPEGGNSRKRRNKSQTEFFSYLGQSNIVTIFCRVKYFYSLQGLKEYTLFKFGRQR